MEDIKDQDQSQRKVNNKNKVYFVIGMCFGLLCFLQVTGNIILRLHFRQSEEREKLLMNYTKLVEERHQLLKTIDEMDMMLRNKLDEECHSNNTSWNVTEGAKQLIVNLTKEKQQLVTSYNNLVNERVRFHQKLQDAGWKSFWSSLYYFSHKRTTWYKAREDCRQRGADLVIISSREELDFLHDTREFIGWIGLTDGEREGVWKWVDGTSLTVGYWRQGEPNDFKGRRDCAISYRMLWNDNNCNKLCKWTCEMKV